MKEILFKVGLFSDYDQRASECIMRALLNVLVTADVEYLRAHPNTPRIYQSGVVYQREPLPKELAKMFPQCVSPCLPPIHPEEWKTIPECIKDRQADCEDLASWATAERIVRDGIAANIDFSFRTIGSFRIYHIFVRLPDGSIEDPSARLGMVKP
jgi:hypothetical protein